MRYFITLLLLFITFCNFETYAMPLTPEKKSASSTVLKKIIIGCTLKNSPLSIDNTSGILIEFVIEIFKVLNQEIRIDVKPWARCQKDLEFGRVDFIFNVGRSEKRLGYAYFTDEIIFLEEYYIFGLNTLEKKIDSDLANLKDASLLVQRGYKYGGNIQLAIDEKRLKETYEVESIVQMIQLVEKSRVDFFVGDRIPTQYYLSQLNLEGKFKTFEKVSNWATHIAFSKKNISHNFVHKVSSTIKLLKSQGVYTKILNKYMK